MAPRGTVMSNGPSVKPLNDFSSPRISSAASDMSHRSFRRRGCRALAVEDVLEDAGDVAMAQAGLGGFADGLAHERGGPRTLGLPALVVGGLGDEGAEPLPAVDEALALEVL